MLVDVCVLEGYGYCGDDYVMVYALRNGSVRPRALRRFCGTNRRITLAERGGLRIRFISDATVVNRGFVATFLVSRS